ncbi:MAG: hypothetical protein ACK44D_00385 [Bacteroidia bacterium]
MNNENLPVLIQNSAQKLGEYFENDLLAQSTTYQQLHERLTALIVYLLLHKMELLLQVLYRVDVFEKDTKAAFAQNDPKLIAPELAKLIIDRELKKAETRIKYKQG